MRHSISCFLATMLIGISANAAVPDTPFIQEYHDAYPIPSDVVPDGKVGSNANPQNDIHAIAVSGGTVFVATPVGVFKREDGTWSTVGDTSLGSTYAVKAGSHDDAWIGAWNGLFHYEAGVVTKIGKIVKPISSIAVSDDSVVAAGPDGVWRVEGKSVTFFRGAWSDDIRRVVADNDGAVWLATGHGLFHCRKDRVLGHIFDELPYGIVQALANAPDGTLWSGGFGNIVSFAGLKPKIEFNLASRMPDLWIQAIAFAPDGTLWAGTKQGCARWDGARWSLRHSRRWLLSDDVRDIAFDADGTAWIATAAGVSAIKKRTMTLEEKAGAFMEIIRARHIRPPGLVERCALSSPGDLTSWKPMDTDNDGQYTSLYLAMQCLRYAVTKDPGAKEMARDAFNAIEFLNAVTPIDGFIARSVIPTEWTEMADRNRTYTPEQIADARVENPRFKMAEPRWRPSTDGKWYWKGDTSSDEIDGHMFGMYYFYELVADDEEKERVRHHVVSIVDHIIRSGYVYNDIDGTHTKWGVWAPKELNSDPDWRGEAPLNKLEILGYLAFAHHLSGDPKYVKCMRTLVDTFHYDAELDRPVVKAPSDATHINSFLLALDYPWLLSCDYDQALREKLMKGFDDWYDTIKNDDNPFFTFVYAIHGQRPIDAKPSLNFLRDAPLDMVEWTVDNSHRGDIDLVHEPEVWPPQTSPLPPASERGVMRWDGNPFDAVRGAQGRVESSTVYWLLPYWMGRYYGLIGPPAIQY